MVQCAQRTAIRGRVSYPQEVEGWSEASTLFLYIGPLVQTTSDNASKAVQSSTGPSVVVGLTVPAQQKSSSFTITFERNTFSKIHESKSKKTRCYFQRHLHSDKMQWYSSNKHTDRHTHRTTTVSSHCACAPRLNYVYASFNQWPNNIFLAQE